MQSTTPTADRPAKRSGRHIDADLVKQAARGRELEMLTALAGIPAEILDGRHHGCPDRRCGGSDRFRLVDREAGAVLCNQCFNSENGDWIAAVMHYRGWTFRQTIEEAARYLGVDAAPLAGANGKPHKTSQGKARAPVVTLCDSEAAHRDRAYHALLGSLELSDSHRQALRQRGLSDDAIDAAEYRTWSGSALVATKLFWSVGRDKWKSEFETVPGFGPGLNISCSPGLLLPVRDAQGRIIAISMRPDEPPKSGGNYRWLSSRSSSRPDGLSPGAPAHSPIGTETPVDVARATEGHLKADITTALSGVLTLGFAGVNNWRNVLPLLAEIKAKTVRLAFDADAATNTAVARAMLEAVRELPEHGYAVEVETWPIEAGKGIDDVLAAGRDDEIEIATGDDAVRVAEEIARSAGVDLDKVQAASKPEKTDSQKASQSTLLVQLVADHGELWHAQGTDTAYVTIKTGAKRENLPIRGKAFRRWLAKNFYQEHEKTPASQAVADSLVVMEGQAMFGGKSHDAFLRVAEHEGKLYLDLADDLWQAVEIDADGWRVVSDHPVRFRRTKSMLPLPSPEYGGDVKELKSFVNVDDDTWPLLLAWLAAAFRPASPYPILELHGEQGSSKSTTARVVRSLIDPVASPLRQEPREPRDLMIASVNSWVTAFDNLSYVAPWLSDCLCRLSTGGGFATRELYSNDEEIIFDAMRPIILTGIEEVATRSDLLDRSIVVQLPKIPKSKRLTEQEFFGSFRRAHARLLGCVLDGVAAAIRNLPTTRVDELPRMADFALWGVASESGFSLSSGTFLNAYTFNIESANETVLESSPIARYVADLSEEDNWKGTASELLTKLENLATEKQSSAKSWPKSARSLSGILKRLAPNLRASGIEISHETEGRGSTKKRIIRICRVQSGDAKHEVGTQTHEVGTQNDFDSNPSNSNVGDAGDDGDAKNPSFLHTLKPGDNLEGRPPESGDIGQQGDETDDQIGVRENLRPPRPPRPHLVEDEMDGCRHDWQDDTESDGRTRRFCKLCYRFAGFVLSDGTVTAQLPLLAEN